MKNNIVFLIPTYQRTHLLPKLVEWLEPYGFVYLGVQTEKDLEELEKLNLPVQIVWSELGVASTRRTLQIEAMKNKDFELFINLDDDLVFRSGNLEEWIAEVLEDDSGYVGCVQHELWQTVRWLLYNDYPYMNVHWATEWWGVKRWVFEEVGYVDDRFNLGMEDMDWSVRGRVVTTPRVFKSLTVSHPRRDPGGLIAYKKLEDKTKKEVKDLEKIEKIRAFKSLIYP